MGAKGVLSLAIRPPLSSGNNHINLAAAAFGADQPPAPIEDRDIGPVSLRLLRRIGLDLMAAISAPHDEANLGTGGVAERHRRPRLGFHR